MQACRALRLPCYNASHAPRMAMGGGPWSGMKPSRGAGGSGPSTLDVIRAAARDSKAGSTTGRTGGGTAGGTLGSVRGGVTANIGTPEYYTTVWSKIVILREVGCEMSRLCTGLSLPIAVPEPGPKLSGAIGVNSDVTCGMSTHQHPSPAGWLLCPFMHDPLTAPPTSVIHS